MFPNADRIGLKCPFSHSCLLQDHVAKMASEPLSLNNPLWEIQVLHNFREPRDTVLLFRVHLAMADGTSMVRILENAIVDSQKASPPKACFGVEAANMSPIKAFFLEEEGARERGVNEAPWPCVVALVATALGSLALFVFPGPIIALIELAIS